MTRRLLTISFSLFLVSAMMGTFPIPGTNSVSIPSGTLLESPSSSPSSSAISVVTDAGVIAGTGATTHSSSADSHTLHLTNVTESINAAPPGAGSPELIKVLRGEALTSEAPPTTASSGFSRSSTSPLTAKQPAGPPQKRAVADSSQQKWIPSQSQQGQQGQQGQQWYQQGQGQQRYPSQGQGQQWYPSQGQQGQQWYPSQGQQGQQWYPSQGQQGQWYQQGQQWYQQQGQGLGQQLGKSYTIQKRAAATAPQGGSPTYRMSALVCNLDTTARGLIHCSDNKNYYTLEQPPNPANSADPRNRPWSAGTGTGTTPAGQDSGAAGPAAAILRRRDVTPQGVGYQRSSIGSPAAPPGGVSTLEVDPQGWFRRPQPYGAQPQPQSQSQPQLQQAQVYKRQAAGTAVAAAADATNQAAAASLAKQANAATATSALSQAAAVSAARQRGHPDLSNLNKWSDSGYTGGNEGGGDRHGKGGSTGYGKGGASGGQNWRRLDLDEGNLSKWSQAGAGSGYGNGGRDEWSHYGKGGGGKKRSKREGLDEGNLSKWSGSGSGYGHDGGDDWSRYGKGDNSGYGTGGKGDKKKWYKRQVPGAPGAYGRPNTGAISVPIDVGLVWDGNSVNLIPPRSSRSGPGGPGSPGGPGGSVAGVRGIPAGATVVGANSPAIPVPINVDALVYPDGQMQIFPSATPN